SHTIGHMAEGTSHVPPTRGPVRTVSVLDVPLTRVRRPIDLVMMLATIAGLVAVFVLSVYAYRTTAAVTLDVQSVFARVLRNLLLIPVNAIEGFLTLILPIVIVVQQLIQRQVRAVVDALTAAVAAILITAGVVWVLENLTPDAMVRALVLYELSGTVMTVSLMVAGLAAFLTGTGTKDERRLVSISWNLLWIVLVVSVIAGKSTLAGALVSVLLGRAVGLGARYASGVLSRRAHGQVLVEGIRRAGVDARSVIRLGERAGTANLQPESVGAANPIGYVPGTGTAAAGTPLPETSPPGGTPLTSESGPAAEPRAVEPSAVEPPAAVRPAGDPTVGAPPAAEPPASTSPASRPAAFEAAPSSAAVTSETDAAARGEHVQESATIATE